MPAGKAVHLPTDRAVDRSRQDHHRMVGQKVRGTPHVVSEQSGGNGKGERSKHLGLEAEVEPGERLMHQSH